MTTMTPELRKAIEAAGNEPVRIVDPQTQQTYVVVTEEVFQRVKKLLESDADPVAFYPLLADISPEDWEDRSAYPA